MSSNSGIEEMSSGSSRRREGDEYALMWAALERLPTYNQLRTSILTQCSSETEDEINQEDRIAVGKLVDVRNLGIDERQRFIERNLRVVPEDHEKFLKKFRDRIDKVRIRLPTVEIRFEQLEVEADCYVGSRALPTLSNAARNVVESVLERLVRIRVSARTRHKILKNISGIIKPSRLTLLLGPPSSGKTTLLQALAGKLDPSLKLRGRVSYNGHRMNEFEARKTAAYVSQNDVHTAVLTVKETLDFSARFQGVGSRFDLLVELVRREKEAGIHPDAEVDLFMKATAMEGSKSNLITDYILKILGLDVCKDTIVGDEMQRGISGGQKKRVTTGEMIVGPAQALFMDEISTGLDSSTTFQIVKSLQVVAHITEATIVMSLLQPSPETYDLFDNIILLSEGQILYMGPRDHALQFFESCGFACPERKGVADFLQEVTSKKDQEQYLVDRSQPYIYKSASEFAELFKAFHVGQQLTHELAAPYDKASSHKAALVFSKYTIPKLDLLKASFDKEMLLIKRQAFVYVFKTIQIIVMAIIASTVFLRTTLSVTYDDGLLYIGAIIFTIVANMFNGFAELSLTMQRLPVFYKHRDLLFHPAWAFTVPNFLLRIPISALESIAWTVVSYYTIGYAPEISRFFKQLLLVFLVQQMAAGIFRLIAGICRTMIISQTGGALSLLLVFLLGGFIIPEGRIPKWWRWGHQVSPLSYAFNAMAINEMLSTRWMNELAPDNSTDLGVGILQNFDAAEATYWYWIGVGALTGFIILFNVLFTVSLIYLNPLGKSQAIISKKQADEAEPDGEENDGNNVVEEFRFPRGDYIEEPESNETSIQTACGTFSRRGMILPFKPLSMCFDVINYYVDMPSEMMQQGVTGDRLQLLREVTGSFRPGVLTALMGVSGAGKTTLMDVLAGRKTGGYIEGDIRISGFPKKQETFARISGYCEQTDIHSPRLTVGESIVFSAFLRLPKEISNKEKMVKVLQLDMIFVDEVMKLVELDRLKDAIVGLPSITGLSTEQRKRLTIAVELVANPSIIFMDEPTSGLDARAAAIVMRAVRNTVDTGRTVVCTIHQPSIEIFEAFDELLLMKRGGQVIYSGQLGQNSCKVIEYFESIPGIPKIRDKYNPAAWMLEVTSDSAEARLGGDFAEYYKQNKELVRQLSVPQGGASDLYFGAQYSHSAWDQFKSCLWKQWWTYWRSPDYNLVRYTFTLFAAVILGSVFWRVGTRRESAADLTMIIGAMYVAVVFIGINNCSTVQPIVSVERTVLYRERAAGMYSALPYAIAQVVVEIPYIFVQTTYYSIIVYTMVCFQWTPTKFLWFFFISFFSFLYFTYYGMMTVSITPNHEVAAIFASAFYGFFTLFSGFFIPRPRIPKWWTWYYWICPVAWTVYGLIVSQYGDLDDTIKVPGTVPDPSIKWYVENHFGYDLNFMGWVAVVLVAFAVFFAFIFAFCIKKLNFQQR